MHVHVLNYLVAGSIIMAIDAQNRYLATGDVDGSIKVWDIKEYCLHQQDEIVTAPPSKYKHQGQINILKHSCNISYFQYTNS